MSGQWSVGLCHLTRCASEGLTRDVAEFASDLTGMRATLTRSVSEGGKRSAPCTSSQRPTHGSLRFPPSLTLRVSVDRTNQRVPQKAPNSGEFDYT